MSGRLGMTGDQVGRGDALVAKAAAKSREKRDYSGAAVGTGTVLGTAGLVGGGVPGARPESGRIAHVKRGTKYEASRHLVSATRGGIFGYRADAHQSFLNRQNADELAHGGKKTTRVNHYLRGQGTGKIAPEKKIIEHMRAARVGSNYALAGGAVLTAAGIQAHRRRQGVGKAAKRDDFRSDALIAGGATTALGAGAGSLALDREGRKWSRHAAASLEEAQRLNPKTGGYDTKRGRHRVPDVVPKRGSSAIVRDKKVLLGRSSKATEAVGRARGAAAQHRYFAGVYGSSARLARKIGVGGAVVGAAGLGGKYLQGRPQSVRKAHRPIPYTNSWMDEKGKIYTPDIPTILAHHRPKEPITKPALLAHNQARSVSPRRALAGVGAVLTTGASSYALGRRSKAKPKAVAKSFVPGQGWVSASKVPKGQLRRLAGGERAMHARVAAGKARASQQEFRDASAATRHFVSTYGLSTPSKGKQLMPTRLSRSMLAENIRPGIAAAAMKTGGRRSRGEIYAHPGTTEQEIAHERAHLTPKRSGYRLYQINKDPVKGAREEARADFVAGFRYRTSPGSSGYAEAAADEAKRKKQHYRGGGKETSVFSPRNMAHYRRTQDLMERNVRKVETTMSEQQAARLAQRYDTRGPLPKGLSREQKMKAYEARYVHSGGRKAEKWKRRASGAELGRNIGLAGATVAAGGFLAASGRRTGPALRAIPKVGRHMTRHKIEAAGAASGALGGAAELYGEYARHRRASYQNSPAGVAGSALSRMQAYTPEKKS